MRILANTASKLLNLKHVFYIIGKYDPVINSASVINEVLSVRAKYKVLKAGYMSHIENRKELMGSLRNFARLI